MKGTGRGGTSPSRREWGRGRVQTEGAPAVKPSFIPRDSARVLVDSLIRRRPAVQQENRAGPADPSPGRCGTIHHKESMGRAGPGLVGESGPREERVGHGEGR